MEKKIEKKRFSNGQHVKEKNSQKIMYDQNQVMNMLEEKIWMDNGHCLSFLVLKWERVCVCVCQNESLVEQQMKRLLFDFPIVSREREACFCFQTDHRPY